MVPSPQPCYPISPTTLQKVVTHGISVTLGWPLHATEFKQQVVVVVRLQYYIFRSITHHCFIMKGGSGATLPRVLVVVQHGGCSCAGKLKNL